MIRNSMPYDVRELIELNDKNLKIARQKISIWHHIKISTAEVFE